ncbi:MAG: hypothetical protein KI792_13690 [Alphaproteobacteria bacterium]|nr:hypothetical protein [Alphaproteobacteria bacterium SS10]
MSKKQKRDTGHPLGHPLGRWLIYSLVLIAIGLCLALTLYRLQRPLNAYLETQHFALLIGLAMAIAAPFAIYLGRIGVMFLTEGKRIRREAKATTDPRRQIQLDHGAQAQSLAGLGILMLALLLGYGLAGGVVALNAFAGPPGETLAAKVESAKQVKAGSDTRHTYCRIELAVSNGATLTMDRRATACRQFKRGMAIEIAYAPGLFKLPVYSLVSPSPSSE